MALDCTKPNKNELPSVATKFDAKSDILIDSIRAAVILGLVDHARGGYQLPLTGLIMQSTDDNICG